MKYSVVFYLLFVYICTSYGLKKYWANYYSINCGGPVHTSIEGILFQEDLNHVGTPVSNKRVFLNVNWKDQPLYQTMMLKDFFSSKYRGPLTYTIPSESSGEYMFGLKLAHPGSKVCERTDVSPRFNVSLNNEIIIGNIDLCKDCKLNMACDDLFVFFNITDDALKIEALQKDYEKPVAVREKKINLEFIPIEEASVVVHAFLFLRKKPYFESVMRRKINLLHSQDPKDYYTYHAINCGGPKLTSSEGIEFLSNTEGTYEYNSNSYSGVLSEDQDLYRYFKWLNYRVDYNFKIDIGRFLIGFKFGRPRQTICNSSSVGSFSIQLQGKTLKSNMEPCKCGSSPFTACKDVRHGFQVDHSHLMTVNDRGTVQLDSSLNVLIRLEANSGRSVMISAYYVLRYIVDEPPIEEATSGTWDGQSLTIPSGQSDTHSNYVEYVVHSDFPDQLKLFLLFFFFLLLLFITVAGYW